MEPESLHTGEVEKWSRTARGMAWRLFHVSVTTREIRWRVTTEASQANVYLGSISVPRIVNAKVDPNSPRGDGGVHTIFVVQEPEENHEFRTVTVEQAQYWVQHIKNATLPKTRRKWPAQSTDSNITSTTAAVSVSTSLPLHRTHSNGSSHSSLVGLDSNRNNPMVTEVQGNNVVQRPISESDGQISKSACDLTVRQPLGPMVSIRRLQDSMRIRKRNSLTLPLSDILGRMSTQARGSVSSDTDASERNDDAPTVREGYLIKQGNLVKSWRRRWFTLSRSFLIYRDEEGTPSKGQIRMGDVKLTRKSDKYPEKRFMFEVITNKRVFYMQASSQEEMDGWTEAISHILMNPNCTPDNSSLGSA